MPDLDPVAKVRKAISDGKGTPEQRARWQQWLSTKETAPKEEVSGMSTVGKTAVVGMSPVERAKEEIAKKQDRDQSLLSESQRVSLYSEPLFEGKKGIGAFSNSPFVYYEPKIERVKVDLQSYRSQVAESQRADIDSALSDLEKNGQDSRTYKEAADALWKETRAEFERQDAPIQRVKHAPVTGYRTAVNKVAGSYAAPMLYGADQAMAFGLGSALAPTGMQDVMSGTSPEQKRALDALRKNGVMPPDEELRGQEYDPWLSGIGGLAGMLALGPKSLGGQAARAGFAAEGAMKAAAPAWLRGTTLGSRLLRSAAGGVVSGAAAGAGTQAVTEGFEAAHGGEFSVGDVAAKAGIDAAIGGIASPVMTMAGEGATKGLEALGAAAQKTLRQRPGLGYDLLTAEQGGAKTSVLSGAKRSPEMQSLADEALEPKTIDKGLVSEQRVTQSPQQSALQPIADRALSDRSARTTAENATMMEENAAGYARLGEKKARTYPIVNQLLGLVKSRRDVPFTELNKFVDALNRTADIQPMLKTDPGLHGRATLSMEEARSFGLDPEKIMREGFAKNTNGVTGKDVKNIVLTIQPKELTAQQLDDATQGLGNIIKWGKDAGSRDREYKRLYESLVKTREQFGDEWANVKRGHDETLRSRGADMEALGLAGDELKDASQNAQREAAYNAISSATGKGTSPAKVEAINATLRNSPEMGRRLTTHKANEAFDRLPRAINPAAMVKGLASGNAGDAVALRMDPVFGMLKTAGVAGARASKNQALRSKLQEIVGNGVDVPDSVLDAFSQILNTVRSTVGDDK